MDKSSDKLTIFGIKSTEPFFTGIQGPDELRHFVNVLVSIIFHITVKYIFQGSQGTFGKFSRSLTYCRVTLHSFNLAEFYELSSRFCSLVDLNKFGSIQFCNHSQKSRRRFSGIFWFHPFCFYGSISLVDTLRF